MFFVGIDELVICFLKRKR